MSSRSVSVKMPHFVSMVAWAMEPWISCSAIRLSKSTEAVKTSTKASVAWAKRALESFSELTVVMNS